MDKVPPKPKRAKGATREQLLSLDKNELVDRIMQLEAHCTQLRNIISKNLSESDVNDKLERKKPFDFAKCNYRRVLLHILYFGWDYQGLAVQEDSNQTIEHHLFHALQKSCLIENRENSQYHRCGRTDKGVSAFGQVISITLRSKLPPDEQLKTSAELPYCKILNRILPKEIRAVAWLPVPEELPEYSARFDCKKRTYKYYFPRSNLCIPSMRSACSSMIGHRDFRHLCKMDVAAGVTEFMRHVFAADISPVDEEDCDKPTSMYVFTIEGNAFLWHQIRCLMGVLLLIGQGHESPDIIERLLDVENCERRPQYSMALDIPLNLFHCTYDLDESLWVYEMEELKTTIVHLQSEWTIHSVKSTMIKDCLQHLEKVYSKTKKEMGDTLHDKSEGDNIMAHSECLIQGVKAKVYVPLMKRVTCSSLEERIEHYKKKRKVVKVDDVIKTDTAG